MSSVFFEHANSGRGSIENSHLMFFNNLGPSVGRRKIRRSFKNHGADAVKQRSIESVGMAGNPARIGSAPENIIIVKIKYELACEMRLHRIAAARMHHAFGLTSGT